MKSRAQYPAFIVLGLILFLGGTYLGHRLLFPDLPLVGIIQWTKEIGGFEECLQGVIEGLREEGFQEGLNIRLEVRDARGEWEVAAAAARDFQKSGARLIITMGTVPTLIALEVTSLPVVYTTVGSPNATGLQQPAPPAIARFTGTSMEVPIQEQLQFLLLALPGIKRLGILYCTATPPAVATGEEAVRVSPKLGLIPIWHTVPDENPELLQQTLTDLLHEKIQALFIPTDPVLGQPKNLQLICHLTARASIPVMMPNGDSVPYGPLLAYHADFMEMGRQCGRQAAQILKGTPLNLVPPESPAVKKLTINLKAAQELGILLPRQLISQARQFYP
ncbi:MAG: ABC transporter substrate-binding protein [Thermodesulfobacteriota bacterium]